MGSAFSTSRGAKRAASSVLSTGDNDMDTRKKSKTADRSVQLALETGADILRFACNSKDDMIRWYLYHGPASIEFRLVPCQIRGNDGHFRLSPGTTERTSQKPLVVMGRFLVHYPGRWSSPCLTQVDPPSFVADWDVERCRDGPFTLKEFSKCRLCLSQHDDPRFMTLAMGFDFKPIFSDLNLVDGRNEFIVRYSWRDTAALHVQFEFHICKTLHIVFACADDATYARLSEYPRPPDGRQAILNLLHYAEQQLGYTDDKADMIKVKRAYWDHEGDPVAASEGRFYWHADQGASNVTPLDWLDRIDDRMNGENQESEERDEDYVAAADDSADDSAHDDADE